MENTLIEWVNEEMEARGWTMRELARRAHTAPTTISNILSHKRLAGWDVCAALARAFGVSPIEGFIRAGKITRAEALVALPLLTSNQTDLARQIAATAQTLSTEEQRFVLQMLQALAQKKQE
jgi:transcriptional regulator with XRE-family HTH domain